MNKVILLGRLSRDPDVRYSMGETPVAVARFPLAVNRRVKKENEQKADFIPCVAFGKMGEFAEKYLKKGQQINVVGRIQTRSWNDTDGSKRWSTDIVVEEVFFAESKKNASEYSNSIAEGFVPMDESIEDEDLPF